jgi:Mn2+/Fe2+ NRAMP family transporter
MILGVIIWISISFLVGKDEAWDSKYYFLYGLPLMMFASGVFGYIEPNRPWRWGIAIVFSQALILWLKNPTANLLPFGIVVFGFICVPCIATAYFGSFLKFKKRDNDTPL